MPLSRSDAERCTLLKVTINKKGVITIKKGKYKKGTYKLKVKVTAKGSKNYEEKSITKTIKIKIKK